MCVLAMMVTGRETCTARPVVGRLERLRGSLIIYAKPAWTVHSGVNERHRPPDRRPGSHESE